MQKDSITFINNLQDEDLRAQLSKSGYSAPPISDAAVRNILRRKLLKFMSPEIEIPETHSWYTSEDDPILNFEESFNNSHKSVCGDNPCEETQEWNSVYFTTTLVAAIVLFLAFVTYFLPKEF